MNSAIARSQATNTIAVSTVRVREGRSVWFETAIVVGGAVSDGMRSETRGAALVLHDNVCDWARGYCRDARRVHVEFFDRALAGING